MFMSSSANTIQDQCLIITDIYGVRDYIIICITVCYFTGIFYAIVRQISMLFINNKDSVFVFRILLFCGVQSHYDVMKGDITLSLQ